VLRSLGRHPVVLDQDDVEEGIKAARLVFPRVYFDTKATRLVDCLKRYRRVISTTTNQPGSPLHDEYSHGADNFRYLAMSAERMKNSDSKPVKVSIPQPVWL
jgi:phage terminase large subunit